MTTARLPQEILGAWNAKSRDCGLLSNHALMQVIGYCLPPLAAPALRAAIQYYAMDHNASLSPELTRDRLDTQLPSRLATHYPLYVALTDQKYLGLDNSLARLGRRLMSRWFSEVSSRATATTYYAHLLSVRAIATIIAHSHWPTPHIDADPCQAMISAIGSDQLAHQRQQYRESYRIFSELADGKRTPGVPLVKGSGRGHGRRGGNTRRVSQDPWQREWLAALTKQSPTKHYSRPRNRTTPRNDAWADISNRAGFQIKSPLPNREPDPEAIHFQRNLPSQLTPQDDQVLVRQFIRRVPTASLATVSDLHRLPADTVRTILQMPLPPIMWSFVILLLATGLPERRLSQLQSIEPDLFLPGSTSAHDDAPRIDLLNGMLAYRLTDGPTHAPGTANQWVTLVLPPALHEDLGLGVSTNHKGAERIKHAGGRLNQYLRRRWHHRPGVTPTASRLRATSWLWRRPQARDDVTAATLSGQFTLSLSAPAAYTTISREALQHVFDATIDSLGVDVSSKTPGRHPMRLTGDSVMGSPIAQPPQAFVPLFRALDQARIAPAEILIAARQRRTLPRQPLIAFAALIATHTYLGWMLVTGARPLGDESRNRLSHERMWIQDKHSNRGGMSRVIPIDRHVAYQLRLHAQWIHHVAIAWERHGGRIDDRRCGERDTPAWLTSGRRNDTLVIRDIAHSDATTVLQNIPDIPIAVCDWPSNVTRHSLASWLRDHRPDAEIDALLGHTNSGRSIGAPHSTASIGNQRQLRQALQRWLHLTGYRPLPSEALLWVM